MQRNNARTTELNLLRVPVPENTDTYTAIPHREIIHSMKKTLSDCNLNIAGESYFSNAKGTQATGTFAISMFGNPDFRYLIGWKNSYDRSLSFGIAMGVQIMVCSNGCVSGEFSLSRKHTGNALDLVHQFVEETVPKIGEIGNESVEFLQYLKTKECSLESASRIAGQFFIQEDLINATQMSALKREIGFSKNFAFKEGQGDLYKLYNNFTEVLKMEPARDYLSSHVNIDKAFRNLTQWEKSKEFAEQTTAMVTNDHYSTLEKV
jgi:hypothetical protein